MQALHKAAGSAVLIAPSGQELALEKHQGLNYIEWDTFEEIRGQLKKSHLEGRISLKDRSEEEPPVPSALCSHVVLSRIQTTTQSTQTEG